MGTLFGHLVPGTFFIIIGLWWIYSSWLRYFICHQRRRPFYVSGSFPVHCCGPRVAKLPSEAFFVIFGTSLGILTELIGGLNRTIDPQTNLVSFSVAASSLQHFAMYLMFLVAGIVQLLLHYKFPLPKYLDVVAGAVAFSGEALLFYFHGHKRDPVEVQIHVFLVMAISATVICGIFEIIQQKKQVYATLMRAYFTLLQGSWFYTAGFFLYSPFHEHYEEKNDPDAHRTLMLIPYYFILHLALSLLPLLILSIPAYLASKRQDQTIDFMKYEHVSMMNNHEEEMEKLNSTTDI